MKLARANGMATDFLAVLAVLARLGEETRGHARKLIS